MFDRDSAHLSDEQLADAANSPHLLLCAECRRRVDEFRAAAAAYVEYRDTVRAPLLPPTPDAWPSLSLLVAQHEAATVPRRSYRWPVLLVAAACAAMAGTLAYKLVEHTATPAPDRTLSHTAAPAAPAVMARPAPTVPKAADETPAGPEDMLRVFRALDDIGADVGEPLDISEDAGSRHIVVRAGGVSPQRRQQIADALQPLPKVSLIWDSLISGKASGSSVSAPASVAEQVTTNIPDAVRERLDDQLGGPIARQEVTDRVLESSASTLARAYAVQLLAEKFPPDTVARFTDSDREMLRELVQHHLSELDRLVSRMRTELKMLLPPSNSLPSGDIVHGNTNWQSGAAELVKAARENDTLLNRLLAGSYSQAEGNTMLASLDGHIRRVEAAVKSAQQEGK